MRTLKQIKGSIKTIATTGKKLDNLIHTTACECLEHAKQHGDATLFSELCNAMPNGSRVRGLIKWAVDHSMLTVEKASDGAYKAKMRKGWKDGEWKLEEAEATPFWEYTTESAPQLMSAAKLLNSVHGIIRKAEKAIEEEAFEGTKEELEAAIMKLQAVA